MRLLSWRPRRRRWAVASSLAHDVQRGLSEVFALGSHAESVADRSGSISRRYKSAARLNHYRKFGTNSVVAGIEISSEPSAGLVEKTNREGFTENGTFRRFRRAVLSAFDHFERLHSEDRTKLVLALKGEDPEAPPQRLDTALSNVRAAIGKDKQLAAAVKVDMQTIENEFEKMREVMVAAGSSGLNLALVVHEVERSIEGVSQAMDSKAFDAARLELGHLKALLKEIGPLLRKEPARQVAVSKVVRSALNFYQARFAGHKVALSAPVLTGLDPDFKVKAPSNLLISRL